LLPLKPFSLWARTRARKGPPCGPPGGLHLPSQECRHRGQPAGVAGGRTHGAPGKGSGTESHGSGTMSSVSHQPSTGRVSSQKPDPPHSTVLSTVRAEGGVSRHQAAPGSPRQHSAGAHAPENSSRSAPVSRPGTQALRDSGGHPRTSPGRATRGLGRSSGEMGPGRMMLDRLLSPQKQGGADLFESRLASLPQCGRSLAVYPPLLLLTAMAGRQ